MVSSGRRPAVDAETRRWARGVGTLTGVLVALALARADRYEVLLAFDRESWPWTAVLWLRLAVAAALAGTGAALLYREVEHAGDGPVPDPSRPRRAAGLAFLALVALGAVLRAVFPSTHPPGPWSDVFQEAMPLLRNPGLGWIGGTPLLAGASGNSELVSHLYLRFYAAVFAVLGRGEEAFLALSAIPGALVPAAAGAVAWRLGGRRAALAATAITALAAWPLVTSRWGYITVAMTALVLGATWGALRALGTGSRAWGALAGLLAGLSLHTYVAAWGAVAALALSGLWAAFRMPRLRPTVAVAFGTGLLAFLPIVPGYLEHRERVGGRTRDIGLWTRSRDVSIPIREGPAALPVALAHNASCYAGLFVGAGDPTPRHGLPGAPALPWAVGVAALVGGGAALRRCAREPAHALVAGVAVGGLLPGLLSRAEGMPNTVRAGVFVVVAFVWAAWALERLARRAAAWSRLAEAVFWALVLGSVVALETAPFLSPWPDDPRTLRAFCVTEAEASRLRRTLSRDRFVVDRGALLDQDVLEGLKPDPEPGMPLPAIPRMSPEELALRPAAGPAWFLTTREGAAHLAALASRAGRPVPLTTSGSHVLVRFSPSGAGPPGEPTAPSAR